MSRKKQKFNNEAEPRKYFGNWYFTARHTPTARRELANTEARFDFSAEDLHREMTATVAHDLVNDIYLLTQPRPIAYLQANNDEMMRLCCKEAIDLLRQYGGYNVVCSGREKLPNYMQSTAIRLDAGFYLVTAKTSMPLLEFLYFTGAGTDASVIREWSGVPEDSIRSFLDALVEFFWRVVRIWHRAASEYGQPVQLAVKNGINISNSQVQIYNLPAHN